MLTPADDGAGATDGSVAVVSHRFWREQLAGADDAVGRQVTLQRRAFTIIGVMQALAGPRRGARATR
jgi:hypothetical protein